MRATAPILGLGPAAACAAGIEAGDLRGPDVARHRVRFFPDRGRGPETRRTDPETGRDVQVGLTAMTVAT